MFRFIVIVALFALAIFWTNELYVVLGFIVSVLVLFVASKSCDISQETKNGTKVQIDLIRKDLKASNIPILDLQIRRINNFTDDLYLINRGKGTARRVAVQCLPKEVFGWGQKGPFVIGPNDEKKLFRIARGSDFVLHHDISVRLWFTDVFGDELYECMYNGPYTNLTLTKCYKAGDKNKLDYMKDNER